MIIITVKYIVIVAFLTICSVHTCIQTFSLLSLQQMIRIYAAVHDMKFYSVISDMRKLKVSNSWFIINLKVLSQIQMCKTHSDHGLNWLPRNTHSFKSSSIACSADMRWLSPILCSFLSPSCRQFMQFVGPRMSSVAPTRGYDVSK